MANIWLGVWATLGTVWSTRPKLVGLCYNVGHAWLSSRIVEPNVADVGAIYAQLRCNFSTTSELAGAFVKLGGKAWGG